MASSLGDLLAEEDFRGRRSLGKSKWSFKSHATSTSNDHSQETRKSDSDLGGQVRNAIRPSLLRFNSSGNSRSRGIMKNLIEGDNFTNREKIDKKSSKEYMERVDGKRHGDVIEHKPRLIHLSKDRSRKGDNIVSEEENESFKDTFSNEVHIRHGVKGEAKEKEQYKERWSGKNIDVEKKQGNSLKKNLSGRINFHHSNKTAGKLPERCYDKSNDSTSNRKSFEDNHSQMQDNFVGSDSIPALDVVAVKAVVSIINGYLKCFLKDTNIRLTLRHSCFTLLNLTGVEGRNSSKVVANLEQAIDVVEKAAEGLSTEKDLKKPLLQLSMIAGLDTNALKDGFTSGISNSKLSACAHVYLGLIFKIHNKENSSAKHILQVFCDQPFQARIILFPELWDGLFLPHLSHIKSWYDHEADSLVDTSRQSSNQKLLDKVYNETLDSGTCKFAVYYKDWLTGIEAPEPSIAAPAVSFEGVDQESPLKNSTATTLPNDFVSPNLMVSKKLYDAMFVTSKNPGAPDTESEWGSENLDNCVRSSNSSNVSKHTQIYYSDTVKDLDQDTDEDSTGSTTENTSSFEICKAQEWKMYNINILSQMDDSEEFCSSTTWKKNEIDFEVLHAQPHSKENNYSRQKLAQPNFEVKHSNASKDLTSFGPSNFSDASLSSLPIKVKPSLREPNDSYESSDERSSLLSIPKDFICPLTGQLYEDPVTLETGQSFEKTAIEAWFDQGHTTCPVTGKKLETLAVPLTNFVLKRVVKNWNSDRRTSLLAFLSQRVMNNSGKCMAKDKNETTIFVLEQFVSACGKGEAMENAKYLIAHGYLQFLIQLCESGNVEEKTRIFALLARCIEADGQCRNQIGNEISMNMNM